MSREADVGQIPTSAKHQAQAPSRREGARGAAEDLTLRRQPLADVLKTYCLKSRSSLIGTAGGNMLSYMARASRTKRARSSSGFGINRMTSPIFAPNLNW